MTKSDQSLLTCSLIVEMDMVLSLSAKNINSTFSSLIFRWDTPFFRFVIVSVQQHYLYFPEEAGEGVNWIQITTSELESIQSIRRQLVASLVCNVNSRWYHIYRNRHVVDQGLIARVTTFSHPELDSGVETKRHTLFISSLEICTTAQFSVKFMGTPFKSHKNHHRKPRHLYLICWIWPLNNQRVE